MVNPRKASRNMPPSSNASHVSIGLTVPGEITAEQAHGMGISDWQLSASARQEIEALESNIRVTQHESGKLLLG